MEGIELISFQIISAVGTARSMYIEAIQAAKAERFDEAAKLLEEGQELFVQGHHAHAQLIQNEANGEKTEFALLLILSMSAEAFGILAQEFIDVYKKMKGNM